MHVHSGEHQNLSQFSSLFCFDVSHEKVAITEICGFLAVMLLRINSLNILCLSPERLMGYYHHCGVNTLTGEQVDVGF